MFLGVIKGIRTPQPRSNIVEIQSQASFMKLKTTSARH